MLWSPRSTNSQYEIYSTTHSSSVPNGNRQKDPRERLYTLERRPRSTETKRRGVRHWVKKWWSYYKKTPTRELVYRGHVDLEPNTDYTNTPDLRPKEKGSTLS